MRVIVLAWAALWLSGCALPPAVTAASFALDFASYGTTGKTMTDHSISLVAQRDCSLLRGLDEGEVCRDESYDFAGGQPAHDAETRASWRFAFLQEETNRANPAAAPGTFGPALRSVYAGDPAIAPGAAPRQQAGLAGAWLDTGGYLRDDGQPLL